MARKLINMAFLGLCVALLNGCAISYLNSDGTQHVIGFVKMTIPGPENKEENAGETVDILTIGILLYFSPIHSGISLGYTHEQITGLRNNVLVLESLQRENKTDRAVPEKKEK